MYKAICGFRWERRIKRSLFDLRKKLLKLPEDNVRKECSPCSVSRFCKGHSLTMAARVTSYRRHVDCEHIGGWICDE